MQDSQEHYDGAQNDFPTISQSDYLMSAEFEGDTDSPVILLEWDGELDVEDDEWDDPEPFAEYDSELRQPLYVMDDDDVQVGIELRIDRWVAQVDSASDTRRDLIIQALRGLGLGRIRRWLPWLGKQQWTGESLLLFLRFRTCWELSPNWWEYSYWDWRARCWYPTRSRYSLTLEDTYELVHHRSDHGPDQIIDETWFADWLELALWQYGFRSFASFAVFRAALGSGNDWTRHIDWYTPDDIGDDEPNSRWNNGYHFSHYGPPLWFCEQTWYEPSEWHDNLGW